MKLKTLSLLLILVSALQWGCDKKDGEYVDLTTGETIKVEKDEKTGYIVNAETRKPVYIYVSPATKDTFYGRTGQKINNAVVKTNDGEFRYEDDGDYVYKDGDYKLKSETDGDLKVKDDDYKKKVDDDGSMKIKDGDTKIKVDEDGEVKIKKD